MLDQLSSAADVAMGSPPDEEPLFVDRPALFALYRHHDADSPHGTGRVVAWVFALAHGAAVLLPVGDRAGDPIRTTVSSARRRLARLWDAELIAVDDRDGLHLAA